MTKSSWKPSLPPARKYKKENLQELLQTSQFIYQIGEYEWLRKPSKNVEISDITSQDFQKKLAYLKRCFLKFRQATGGKGRGIAAVQVGIPERFCLMYMPEQKTKQYLYFINPVITKESDKHYLYPEACMSCNSLVALVVRPSWVEFTYFDERGEKQVWNTKDTTENGKMYNRILEHELDHLDGIINIDKVQSKKLIFETGTTYYEKATFKEV